MTCKNGLFNESGVSFEPQEGRRILLTHIMPIDDQILLLAFHDNELHMNDVAFLVNRIENFYPRCHPEQLASFLRKNPGPIAEWEQKIGSAFPEPGEDAPEITIHIPQGLYEALVKNCSKLQVTIPQLVRAILRFCVDPNTREVASRRFSLNPAVPNLDDTGDSLK